MSFRFLVVGIVVGLSTLAAVPAAHAEEDCLFTQGYWQNRAQNTGSTDNASTIWRNLGPQQFYLSGKTYAEVLLVAPRGNAYWILAHQLVAAEANDKNGADATGVPEETIALAQELMNTYTPSQIAAIPKSDPIRQDFIDLAGILDDWNNGVIGTGLCGLGSGEG
jgi:hypothetical protein